MHGQGSGSWKEPGLQSLSESPYLPEKRSPHTGTPSSQQCSERYGKSASDPRALFKGWQTLPRVQGW